jgi:hypothetical protein
LWTSNTVCTDAPCTQPTGVRWYQFDVTGGTFPATPVQQQTWTNGNDGLYRFMSSIAVDNAGNTAIGYATSSSAAFPGIRYAGRLVSDPPSNLGQGEATLFSGTGSQTGTNGRWGDYSMITIDPADNMTFWHLVNTTRRPAVSTGTPASVNSNSQPVPQRQRRGLRQLRRQRRRLLLPRRRGLGRRQGRVPHRRLGRRSALARVSSGTRDHSRVPVTCTFLFTRGDDSSSKITWRRMYVLHLH